MPTPGFWVLTALATVASTTARREACSGLAVLVAFALGTAVADLLAGGLHLGSAVSVAAPLALAAVVVRLSPRARAV